MKNELDSFFYTQELEPCSCGNDVHGIFGLPGEWIVECSGDDCDHWIVECPTKQEAADKWNNFRQKTRKEVST